MKHYIPNHINQHQNNDQLMPIDGNETIMFGSKSKHRSTNITFQEIERHLQKKKEMGKRLKGNINTTFLL